MNKPRLNNPPEGDAQAKGRGDDGIGLTIANGRRNLCSDISINQDKERQQNLAARVKNAGTM